MGHYGCVDIYDKRSNQIIKHFKTQDETGIYQYASSFVWEFIILNFFVNKGYVNSVQWSPNGELIATASSTKFATVIGFSTGKVIFSEKTADQSNFP